MCPACRIGEENLCDKPRSLGIYTDGGYADHVLVPNYRYLVKIGSDRVMVGSGLVLPILVAYDRRNFIGLDHELRLELVDLVHGRRSKQVVS
jgi:Alcohol dehydrogenase GroES-like domain